MTDLDSSYGIDAAAGVAGKIIGLVGGYATLWLLTDMLTSAGYGGYVAALAVISLLSLVVQAGLSQATIQRVGEIRTTEDQDVFQYIGAAVTWVTISSLAVTILVVAVSPLLEAYLEPTLLLWIRLLVLVLPGMALISVCNGILRGFERIPAAITLRQISVQILRLAGLSFVWVFFRDPAGVVVAIGVSHYLPIAVLLVRTRGWKYLNLTGLPRSHLQFSGYLLLNSIAGRFLKDTDVLLLAALSTLSETGGYSVAWKLAIVARYVDTILTNTLQPRLSKFLANNQLSILQIEFNQVRDLAVAGAIPVLFAVILFGEALLGLFGMYRSLYPVLLLLTIGTIVNAMFGSIGQILIMDKQGRLLLLNTIISLGGNVILNLLLIPRYGAIGAAAATVFTVYFFTNFFAMLEVKYILGIDTIDWVTFSLSGILTAVVIGMLFNIPAANSVAVIVALTVLIALVYRQRGFVHQSLRELSEKVR